MNRELRIKNQIITINPRQTKALGEDWAKKLKGGETIALIGQLGSGKTTFVKGLARGLGVKEKILSPTFVLFKVYKTKKEKVKQFVHVDCYRVSVVELKKIGLTDYLNRPDTVVVIEWGEKIPHLSKNTVRLRFTHGRTEKERFITITP